MADSGAAESDTHVIPSTVGNAEEQAVTLEPANGEASIDDDPVPLGPRAVLGMYSCVVNMYPPSDDSSQEMLDKVLGSRFLVSLFALDSFSWGTGKIFQYEVLLLADDPKLAWCYVIASLVMTSAETFTEFLASLLTPRIFQCFQTREWMTSKQLVHFALKTYTFSNWFALLVYPWFGIAIHGMGTLNPGLVYGLAIVRTLQYAFCNQVGDASIEMAKPHWMVTFTGVKMSFPGLCCSCPFQISRIASTKVLALYLAVVRYITFGFIALVYVSVRKKTGLRWALAGVLLIVNAVAPLFLLRNWRRITRGIGENEIEKEDSTKFEGSLRWSELGFLGFAVITKGVPPQATEAVQSILVIELSSKVQQGFLLAGFILIMTALLVKIHRTPFRPKHIGTSMSALDLDAKAAPNWFKTEWLFPVVVVGVLLAVGATCIGIGKKAFLYIAIVAWLPVAPAYQVLKAAFDTFLLRYDEHRSTNLVYWENVLQVFINAPLLAVNWATVEAVGCDDKDGAEERAAQVLLYLTAGILLLMVFYYSTVDLFFCRKHLSLHALVDASVDGVQKPKFSPDTNQSQSTEEDEFQRESSQTSI